MKIGVDLDGVCADFTLGWQVHYWAWFDRHVDQRWIDDWDSPVKATHFEFEEEFWAWLDCIPNFWSTLPIIQGALGGLMHLKTQGHQLVAVTSRHEKTKQQTFLWLKTNGFFNFIDKDVLHLHKSKKHQAGCDVYLDDNPVVLRDLRERGIDAIRFEQPWNHGVKSTAMVTRWTLIPGVVAAIGLGKEEQ